MKTSRKKQKTKPVQTCLNVDTDVDQVCDIKDVCIFIRDADIRRCVPRLLKLANTKKDRKISRTEALDIIMITTGQRNMRPLENILKRMRKYEIYKGCEAGFSLLIRKPHEIKKFLIDGSLEKNDRKANNQGSM